MGLCDSSHSLPHKTERFQSLPIYLAGYWKGIGVSQPSPYLGKGIADIPPGCQKTWSLKWSVAAFLFFTLARAAASGGPLKEKVNFDEV